MIGFALASLTVLGLLLSIRFLGKHNFLWSIVPANTVAFVSYTSDDSGSMTEGGGPVVDIIHAVPGKRLNKESHDLQEWFFEEVGGGNEEIHSLLYHILGVTWIGFFRTLRWNTIKGFRYTRKEGAEEYHVVTKGDTMRFVPFSGEQAIEVKGAETKSVFGIDLVFNTIHERKFPLKAVLRVADSNAVLTTMIHERVIMVTSMHEPEEILSDDSKYKRSIIKAAEEAEKEALKEIGTHMTRVTLLSVAVSDEDRKLFELNERNQREGEAAVTKAKQEAEATVAKAEGAKKARILANDAEADHIDRVIKPSAENDRTVAVVQAEAYRYNEHVIAVGGTPLISLPTK